MALYHYLKILESYLRPNMDRKYLPIAAAAAGVALGAGAALFWANSKAGEAKSANVADNAYVLLVRIRSKPGRAHEIIDLWRPYADWVEKHEPHTLTYKASVSESDGDVVIIYERYTRITDLTEVHRKSPQFAEFGAKLQESGLVAELNAETFYEMKPGFIMH